MNSATSRALHQAQCRSEVCPSCEDAAEARKDADQEPYDDNGARADEYERYFDGPAGI